VEELGYKLLTVVDSGVLRDPVLKLVSGMFRKSFDATVEDFMLDISEPQMAGAWARSMHEAYDFACLLFMTDYPPWRDLEIEGKLHAKESVPLIAATESFRRNEWLDRRVLEGVTSVDIASKVMPIVAMALVLGAPTSLSMPQVEDLFGTSEGKLFCTVIQHRTIRNKQQWIVCQGDGRQ
jgi:hypothetical protein